MKRKTTIQGLMNQLEHEKNRVKALQERCDTALQAIYQCNDMFSAFIIDTTLTFGERKEENGEIIGYILSSNKVNLHELLDKWELHSYDVNGKIQHCIAPREAQNEAEQ